MPLAFAPVASGCAIGSGLKQLLSNDATLPVLRSWQPTFCADTATANSVIGPLQDDQIRNTVSGPNRMGIVTTPPPSDGYLVTAPVATTAAVVAFNADRVIPNGSKLFSQNATRNTELNLNPRLLAKLLTQSYDSGAAPNGGKTDGYNGSTVSGPTQPVFTPKRSFPKDNPRRLIDDPEFLELNPAFEVWLKEGGFIAPQNYADILVSANSQDAYNVVWRWITADRDAKAFLAGAPDPHGMRVNPYYRGQLDSTTSSFPTYDPTCVDNIADPAADDFPLLCQLNNHPRAENDNQAAQAAVRGDTKRNNVAPTVFPSATSAYSAEPRQTSGNFAMLVLTTASYAERYGLPTAKLRNASGSYVGPSRPAMAAARDQMPRRADGVLLADPAAVKGLGYPLTIMSYAVTDPTALTSEQARAFAAVLDYAAGRGQVPGTAVGTLPPGYAPLSAPLKARAAGAAAVLRTPPATPPGEEGEGEPGTTPVPGPVPVAGGSSSGPAGLLPPVVEPSGPRPVADGPTYLASPVSRTGRVESTLPWLLPVLLCVAAAALVSSRLLRRLGGAPDLPR